MNNILYNSLQLREVFHLEFLEPFIPTAELWAGISL